MKNYYIKNNNYKHSDSDKKIFKSLETMGFKKITIVKCKDSRYLCKKKRTQCIEDKLKKDDTSIIGLVNLLSVGRSFSEIYSLLSNDEDIVFSYIQGTLVKQNDIIFWDDTYQKDELLFCRVTRESILRVKSRIEQYLKQQTIKIGCHQTTKVLQGRQNGSTNKTSDYEPYKNKIIEALDKEMSLRLIVKEIDFGTKCGLAYYIKTRLK